MQVTIVIIIFTRAVNVIWMREKYQVGWTLQAYYYLPGIALRFFLGTGVGLELLPTLGVVAVVVVEAEVSERWW